MCFYADYDWFASVNETTEGAAPTEVKCDECRSVIPAGEWWRYIYLQEHEECDRCYGDGDPCECPKDGDGDGDCLGCQCEKPDYGETYEHITCGPCANLLDAIKAVELDAGCKDYESQPALGELYEAMHETCQFECRKYAERAVAMFPALASHEYVKDALESKDA